MARVLGAVVSQVSRQTCGIPVGVVPRPTSHPRPRVRAVDRDAWGGSATRCSESIPARGSQYAAPVPRTSLQYSSVFSIAVGRSMDYLSRSSDALAQMLAARLSGGILPVCGLIRAGSDRELFAGFLCGTSSIFGAYALCDDLVCGSNRASAIFAKFGGYERLGACSGPSEDGSKRASIARRSGAHW